MGRKVVKGTEKNDKLTAGINTDVYLGGGNDTVTLQGHVNGEAEGVHRVYVDDNDGVNNVYGFSGQDTLKLINGSITDYGMKGNDIYFKNGKTTVWLRNPDNSRYYGDQGNAMEVEVVYKKWQNHNNVSFDYWFSTGMGYTNFIYNPWDHYYGSERGFNELVVNPNSLKNESNLDELSKKEVKNPHIDLRDTSKFKNINAVYAIETKGAVIRGGKNNVELYGSRNGADELWAGTGGSYLVGNGGGTDIYHGGSGYDVFVHGVPAWYANNKSVSTNEIVYGYTSGQDDIEYTGGYHSGIVSGRDVILNFTNGTMRIKDGAGKAIYMYSTKEDKSYVRTFGTPILAKGLSYQNNRQKLLVKAPFKGTVKSATYDSTVKEIDASTVKTAVNIEGNTGNLTIRASQGGGTLYGRRGDDKLYGGKGVDVFLYRKKNKRGNDGHDTIYNYESGKDIIRIEKDKYELSADGKDAIIKIGGPQIIWKNNMQVNLGVDSVRIVNGVGKNIIIQDGNGKKVTKKVYPNPPAYAPWNKKAATVTFNSKTPATTFDVRNYDPSIRNLNGKAAGKRLNLTGNNKNNIIYAGKAGGTLSGLGGNDTLYGGSGVDTFRYTSGADTIIGYQGGRDIIQLDSGSVTGHKVWGSDVTLNIGKGAILIKDGVNKNILVKNAKGKTQTFKYGYLNLPAIASYDKTKTKVTMKASAKGNFDSTGYAPGIVTIDAKAANAPMNIYGNAKKNTIYASKKGGILQGRGGDDMLYGGAGKDTFVYANGDGNDTIYNYTSNQDVIKLLSGKVDSYRLSGKDVILKNGKGSIRVKNAMNKKISIADAKGKVTQHTYTNVLRAGKNGGRIRGNGVDDIFYGNTGTDTFVYGAGDGNMTIYNYASGRDIISVESGMVKGWTSKGNDAIINVGNKTITIKNGVNRQVIVKNKNAKYVFKKGTKHAKVLADGVTYDTDKHLVYIPDYYVSSYDMNISGKDLVVTLSDKKFRLSGMANSPINVQDASGNIIGYWKANTISYGRAYFDVAKKAIIMNADSSYIYVQDIPNGYHIVDAGNSKESFSFNGTSNNEVFYGGKYKNEFYGNGGKDIFYGGSGEDTFYFNYNGEDSLPEQDTIYRYDKKKDKIKLGYYDGYSVKGKDVIFRYRDKTMTVKNTTIQDIRVVDDASGNWRKKRIYSYGASDGNMVIANYISGRDVIYLENGTVNKWSSNGKDAIITVGKNNITIKNGVNCNVIVKRKDGVIYEFPKGTKNVKILGDGVFYDIDKKLVYNVDNILYTAVSGKDLLVKTSSKEFIIPNMGNEPINIQDSNGKKVGYFGNENIYYGYFDFARKAIIINDESSCYADLSNAAVPDGYHIIDARNNEEEISLHGTAGNDVLYGGKEITEFYGAGGKDTFYGGKGKDIFHFDGKEITVFNYDKTRDQISLGEYDGYLVKGNDVVFKYLDSSMTIKNVAVNDINVEGDAAGSWRKNIIPDYIKYENRDGNWAVILDRSFTGNSIDKLNFSSSTSIVDASRVNSYIKMTNAGRNKLSTLIAGQGGSLLVADKSADLYGGKGKDCFEVKLTNVNGYGNYSYVNNYEKGKDIIKIADSVSYAYESDGTVTLSTANGWVSISNARLSDLTVYDNSHRKQAIKFGSETYWNADDEQMTSSLMMSAQDSYITNQKNSLAYISQMQGSVKADSVMHLSNKNSSTISDITLAGHSQSKSLKSGVKTL